jgi:hypothetical protein
LEYGYLKLHAMKEKTHVAYMAKNGKIVKTSTYRKYQFDTHIWEKEKLMERYRRGEAIYQPKFLNWALQFLTK